MLRKIVKKQNIILAVGLLALMLAGGLVIYKIDMTKKIPQAEAASYPVTIKSVQRGIHQATHKSRYGFPAQDNLKLGQTPNFPSSEGKITLSQSVDPSKSIVLINGMRMEPMSPFRGLGAAGFLENSNTLRIVYDIFYGGNDQGAWISWEVVEFTGNVKVLRGWEKIGDDYPRWSDYSSLTDSGNNPLVDNNKSFIIAYTLPSTADTYPGILVSPMEVYGQAAFESPDWGGSCINRENASYPKLYLCFVRGESNPGDSSDNRNPIVYWQVIEMKDVIQNKQEIYSPPGYCGSVLEYNITISSVDLSKTFIPPRGLYFGCGGDQTAFETSRLGRRARLINNTTIQTNFDDGNVRTLSPMSDQVMQFISSSGITIQRGYTQMHRTQTTLDVGIAPADPTRSFVNVRLGGTSYCPWGWSGGSSGPQTQHATAYLLNQNTLRLEQYPTDPNDSTNTNKCAPDLAWEVITFPGKPPLTLPNYTDAISAGATKVRAVHINELRAQINRAEQEASFLQNPWTDGSNCVQNGRTVLCVQADSTKIRAVHFNELCSAINNLKNNLAVSLSLTCSTSRSGQIRAQHLIDLRNDLYNVINTYNSG